MPQDGSNNYQYPPGTPGIPDTTIESEAYNTFLDDLVINDLNIPRPVHRGGTGASTADAALVNLKAEKAEQVVTAYLSQLWMPGSFRSAVGATDAPVAGHAFAGICYINEPLVSPPTNANVTVEARDQSDTVVPGKKYIRQKIAGVWGAWAYEDQDILDAAAPLDALAYNGMQINGSMEVSQENGSTSVALTSGGDRYLIDGWRGTYTSSTAVVRGGLEPSGLAGMPAGLPVCVFLQSTTGAPFTTANNMALIYSPIEGYRTSRLAWGTANAKPITIAFWVQTSVTGTFAVSVVNGPANRSYVADVTVNAALTWEYKTVTIPGDVTGTWANTIGTGIQLGFCFASGSTFRGTAGAWAATYSLASASTTNFFATNMSAVFLTGVVVLPGSQAPTAAQSPMIMRPYDQELLTCRRYWQKNIGGSDFVSVGGPGFSATPVSYGVPMRTTPTLAGTLIEGINVNTTAFYTNSNAYGFWYQITALAAGRCYYYATVTSDARL